ncbi:uncharacterized protein LOC134219712 [Armigeres subalbatus]|uniref:uncharacterized protein LOC134219712 n=1 Tax=Armigeres subalbatus TaxID=124917 RepID=UPI002ECFE197
MPFKIVQTVEKGELCLSVVPSKWEEDGILHWPKKSVVARLCHDENSVPESNWEKLNCVLKRQNLTYAGAYQELERMESIPDTEADENEVVQPKTKKARRKDVQKKPSNVVKDFNQFLTNPETAKDEFCVEYAMENDEEDSTMNPADMVVYEEEYVTENIVETTNSGNEKSLLNAEIECNENLPDKSEDRVDQQEVNNATLAEIVANQIAIQNNQLKMMMSLAQLITSMDILTKKVLVIEKHVQAETHVSISNVPFKPVTSIEELDRLEAELKNEDYMKRTIGKLSTVCGTSGKADGLDSAYRLIDCVITREMINMCSWTGMARDSTEAAMNLPSGSNEPEASASKIPLKFYIKFREMFLTVIRLADHDFSEASCEKFFKVIMKNSKQRLSSKLLSTHKNRPKNLKYGAQKDNSDLDN